MRFLRTKPNLVEGPIVPGLLILAWPIIVSNLLQNLYNLADTFWLGRVGEHAVAAISISFPIIFLFIAFGAGLTIAGTALVAHNTGARNYDMVNYIASQTLGFVGILAIILSILGYIYCDRIVALLGPEPHVFEDAVLYLRTWFVGIPFVFGFFIFQALIKGYGDTINPMKLMLASTVLNIVLDPFLIFGWGFFPEFGVQGAAIATVVSRGAASIFGIGFLFAGTFGLKVSVSQLMPRFDTIKRLVGIGLPAAAEMSMKSVGIILMTAIVAGFGTSTLAAFGVGSRLAMVAFLPSMGLAQSATTMVGQNLGAKQDDRAERTGYAGAAIAFGVLAAFGVGTYFFADLLAGLFLPADPAARALTTQYIMVISFSFGFLGVLNVLSGAFRGAGKTVLAMLFAFISLLLLRVPLAYVLSNHTPLGVNGLWWSVAISNVVGGVLSFLWYIRGSWKQRLVTEERPNLGPSVKMEDRPR